MTPEAFLALIRQNASLDDARAIQRFLADALSDPDLAPYFEVKADSSHDPRGPNALTTLEDVVKASFEAIRTHHISPTALLAVALGNGPSELETLRDKILWLMRGEIVDGPAVRLRERIIPSKETLPEDPRDARAYLGTWIDDRGNVRKAHRGVPVNPKMHGDTGPTANLVRPDSPIVSYLKHRAQVAKDVAEHETKHAVSHRAKRAARKRTKTLIASEKKRWEKTGRYQEYPGTGGIAKFKTREN